MITENMLLEIQGQVANGNMNFIIHDMQFMCVPKGISVLVYAENTTELLPGPLEPDLILSEGRIIVLKESAVSVQGGDIPVLSEEKAFYETRNQIKEIIKRKAKQLVPDESVLQDEDFKNRELITKKAWEYAAYGERLTVGPDLSRYNILDKEDFYLILWGSETVEECAEELYERIQTDLLSQVTIQHMAVKKAEEYKGRYELDIFTLLKGLSWNASSKVTLYMQNNKQKAEANISVARLMKSILNTKGSVISPWQFESEEAGKEIYRQLGLNQRKEDLSLDYVQEIQYDGKTLWIKPQK